MSDYKITEEIMNSCKELEYYDKFRCFSWQKKKVSLTLSHKNIEKLKRFKNKSKLIDDLISKFI